MTTDNQRVGYGEPMAESTPFAQNLKLARKLKGWTQEQLAEAAGTSKGYLSDMEKGNRPFPRGPKLDALASALGVTVTELLTDPVNVSAALSRASNEALTRLPLTTLSVRHNVQAGMWFESDMVSQVEDGPEFPVAPHPQFVGVDQWLERVVGDSMNLFAPEGSLVHVVSMIGSGAQPRQDALVIVERIRAGGHLRERTIKQVNITPGGLLELWPRSTNPKWSEPLKVHEDTDTPEAVTVEIVGLVIGRYQSFL